MKLYIKRNPNELAELAFGQKYINDYDYICHFVNDFCNIVTSHNGVEKKWLSIAYQLMENEKFYLGECSKDQLSELLASWNLKSKQIVDKFLEIEE